MCGPQSRSGVFLSVKKGICGRVAGSAGAASWRVVVQRGGNETPSAGCRLGTHRGAPQINRVIDDGILPDHWYCTSPVRTFRTDACLFIAFYYETADWLTASARLQTIRDAAIQRSTWGQWKDFVVVNHFLTVRFDDLWKSVDDRLRRLAGAEEMVVEDPEILSGTPEIRGTRIPVYGVAALFDAGTTTKEILEMYPRLTKAQVEVASIYAKAVPQRGRPKRKDYPAGTKLMSMTRGSLKRRIAG